MEAVCYITPCLLIRNTLTISYPHFFSRRERHADRGMSVNAVARAERKQKISRKSASCQNTGTK